MSSQQSMNPNPPMDSLGAANWALQQELAALRQQVADLTAWRPISTAPKDGTRVLTYRAEFRESMGVAFFDKYGRHWVPVNGSAWPDPTHWLPLPPPPAALREGEE